MVPNFEITIKNNSAKHMHDRKNVSDATKWLILMVNHLASERGKWPFFTPEKIGDETKQGAPPLSAQVWEFLRDHLDQAEKQRVTVGTLVSLQSNDTTISLFWR